MTERTICANADKIRECAQIVTPLSAVSITKGRDMVMDNVEKLFKVWIDFKYRGTCPIVL